MENNTNKPQGLSEGWARPLNRGDRLIELRNYSSKGQQISGLWKPTVRYGVTAKYSAAYTCRLDCTWLSKFSLRRFKAYGWRIIQPREDFNDLKGLKRKKITQHFSAMQLRFFGKDALKILIVERWFSSQNFRSIEYFFVFFAPISVDSRNGYCFEWGTARRLRLVFCVIKVVTNG